ncbi:MAG: hypothetical protein M1812_005846 [Candelaria pacifica]|nr:MAG: hypothetical protein M1812_005846 [Candelaria pacifica]
MDTFIAPYCFITLGAISTSSWACPWYLASSSTLQDSLASSMSTSDDAVESTNQYPQMEEGDSILRGHDFSAILLLIRFWPYPDKSLLRSVLCNRRVSVVATLLVVAGVGNQQAVAKLSKDQMLDRLELLFPSNSPTWQPLFGPRQAVDQTPDGLAATINQQSWRQFHSIPFEDLVQYTLGHSATSVEDFLHYHTSVLPTVVSRYLYMYPDQLQRYRLATHALSNQNPFAHRALSLGLQPHFLPSLDDCTASSELSYNLEFIVAPLRKILQSQGQPLEGKLRQLAVLAVRYRLSYPDHMNMDWVGNFQTNTLLFESILKESPQELAELITDSDLANFRNLSLQNFEDNDEALREISHGSNEWSLAVREGALVGQYIAKKALEVAKAG